MLSSIQNFVKINQQAFIFALLIALAVSLLGALVILIPQLNSAAPELKVFYE